MVKLKFKPPFQLFIKEIILILVSTCFYKFIRVIINIFLNSKNTITYNIIFNDSIIYLEFAIENHYGSCAFGIDPDCLDWYRHHVSLWIDFRLVQYADYCIGTAGIDP